MTYKEKNKQYFHVTYDDSDDQWFIREVTGNEIYVFDNKENAVKKAHNLANNVELGYVVIHDEHGGFQVAERIRRVTDKIKRAYRSAKEELTS